MNQQMVTTPSGLQFQEVRSGKPDGRSAAPGDAVAVHYTGWLASGKQFDSSRERGQPFRFTLGAGQVIRGWDEGVAGMRPGGQRKLFIPAALGYGERGAGAAIPPGADLVFEVELLEVSGTPRSAREHYNQFTDTVTGINFRLIDNLMQGAAILVCAGLGGLIGWLAAANPTLGAVGGAAAGLLVGLFGSGIFLMVYRAVRHWRGKHD